MCTETAGKLLSPDAVLYELVFDYVAAGINIKDSIIHTFNILFNI